MTYQNIQMIIEDLARENARMYPEHYPIEDGIFNEEAGIEQQELAKSYFENRTEEEMKRDEKANVTLEDYAVWIGNAMREELIEDQEEFESK